MEEGEGVAHQWQGEGLRWMWMGPREEGEVEEAQCLQAQTQ